MKTEEKIETFLMDLLNCYEIDGSEIHDGMAHIGSDEAETIVNKIMLEIKPTLNEVTYDSIALGWEGDHHFRYLFAIQYGKIIYKEKVSDDKIPHSDVVRQCDIENYVKQSLISQKEKIE